MRWSWCCGGASAARRLAPAALALWVALVLARPASAGARAQAQEPAPQPVRPLVLGLELRSDVALDPKEVWRQVEIVVGEPLAEPAVRRTLRNLHALGLGSDVAIYSRPAQPAEGSAMTRESPPAPSTSGIVAVIVVVADFRVASLELVGHLGLRASELRERIEQRVGAPLYEDRLVRGVFRLRDLYEEEGYRQAVVRLDVDLAQAQKTAHVLYRIESGERALVREVKLEGQLGPFAPEQLLEPLRLVPGARETRRELLSDRERLLDWLHAQGYRRARVGEGEVAYDRDANQIDLTWAVEVGPEVAVRVEGADVEQLRRADLLPFLGSGGFDEALVQQAVRRLREHYQSSGHYAVEIESQLDESGQGRLELLLRLALGPLHELESFSLEGNESFDDDALAPLLITPRQRRLVDAVLERDLENLRAYYLLQGFAEVEVGPVEIERGQPSLRTGVIPLAVRVPVREGRQRRVSGLVIEGTASLDLDALGTLPLYAGGPFHPQLLAQLEGRLRAAYDEQGFERVSVVSDLDWDETGALVNVRAQVKEGARSIVDRVIVRGNLRTRTAVIRRVLALEPGQPVSRARLLEAQRRLHQLGVFSRVEVTAGPRVRRADEDQLEKDAPRDVLVRVEEGKQWRLAYGGSLDSEGGLGGLFGATYSNFRGRASSLRLDLRANQLEERYRLLLTDRSLGRGATAVNYSLYRITEEISEFDSTREGLQVEALRFFGRFRASLFYDYRNVKLDLLAPEPRDEVPRELQEVEISSATATLLYDRRDDLLAPTRGWSGLFQAEQAFPLLSAEERFFKLFVQGSRYQGLGPWGVLAMSLRLGGIEPQRGVSGDVIPISERFFAGGGTTHRAFERDELGIPGDTIIDGIAVGGNGLVLANLDYRFPIVGKLGGILFFDTGNVFSDYRDIDPSDFRHGAGLGLRYDSPIGPLRLEVGFKLDRLEGEDGEVVFFSFGNPF